MLLDINNDDENSKLLKTADYKGSIFTVGIESQADYVAKDVKFSRKGMSFTVSLKGEDYQFRIPNVGSHNVIAALFAIGVGDQLGVDPEILQSGLNNSKKPSNRLSITELRNRITIIDDTVHAHPPAMKSALDILETIDANQRIAVLGSMAELGDQIIEYHEDVGKYASTKNLDFLFTYGNLSRSIGEGAIKNGFNEENVRHKTPLYRRVLHRELVDLIKPGAVILVKGASRLNMVETVEFLCEYYRN